MDYRKMHAIMIICFVLGGFSIMLYAFQAYSELWRTEMFAPPQLNAAFNRTFENRTFLPRESVLGVASLTSPFSFMLLFNGVALLFGGFAIWSVTREKELRTTKEKLTTLLLLPEERTVIAELKKANGSLPQSQLVRNTGLSKVKIHRILVRLSQKGIVKKHPYGLTNKIVLEKEA